MVWSASKNDTSGPNKAFSTKSKAAARWLLTSIVRCLVNKGVIENRRWCIHYNLENQNSSWAQTQCRRFKRKRSFLCLYLSHLRTQKIHHRKRALKPVYITLFKGVNKTRGTTFTQVIVVLSIKGHRLQALWMILDDWHSVLDAISYWPKSTHVHILVGTGQPVCVEFTWV